MYFTKGKQRAFELLMQQKPGFDRYQSRLLYTSGGKTYRIPCGMTISNGFVPINEVLAQSGFWTHWSS